MKGVEVSIAGPNPVQGIADSGDVEQDLRDLLLAIGEAAIEQKKSLDG